MATALTTALHRVKPEETSRESLLELHRIEMIGESPMDLQWISNGSPMDHPIWTTQKEESVLLEIGKLLIIVV